MQQRTASDTTTGHGWHRIVIVTAALAVVVEGILGTVAILRDFGPTLWGTVTGRPADLSLPGWVFGWEALQLLAALSLPFLALLILRGSRPGYLAALILQGLAIGVSGYRVLDTLPDTIWLIAIVAITTILLSMKSVRDWCLGRSNDAFRRLIVDRSPTQHTSG